MLPKRMFGSKILCDLREDLDQSSTGGVFTGFVDYKLTGQNNRMGVFQALRVGPGKVVAGFQEKVDVVENDLLLVNVRDVDNYVLIEGKTYALLEYYNVMGKLVARPKPAFINDDTPEVIRKLHEKVQYDIVPLQNFVLVEQDEALMNRYTFGESARALGLVMEGVAVEDGYASDNERSNRFPVQYVRVVSAGPGKVVPKIDGTTGITEVIIDRADVEKGQIVSVVTTTAQCRFTFQTKKLGFYHARGLMFEIGADVQ